MGRLLRTLTAGGCALAVFAAGPVRAAPTVAMNGHLPSEADCAAMEALGATMVRMDFNWFQFEPAQDEMQWAHLDAAVASARAHNLAIYATVAYTPQWASSVGGCVQNAPDKATRCDNKLPADSADWADAVTKVVTRFQGQVACWGIWNEPNLGDFFEGTQDEFVDRIFVPAANAIRAADPAAKICGPELAGLADSSQWNGDKGTCMFGGCIRNGWERDLAELLDRVGAHIDIVTQHTYQADGPAVMKALLDGSSIAGIVQHDAIRNVVNAHGGANKEFWLTETGWEQPPQGGTSEQDAAARIVDLYAKQEEVCAGTYAASANDPWPHWTRTFYYHFPYDPGSGWGIVNADGSPRPAYSALQAWAAGRTTTACTGPSGQVRPDAGTPAGPDAAEPAGPDAAEPSGPDAATEPGLDASTVVTSPDANPSPPDSSAFQPGLDGGLALEEDASATKADVGRVPEVVSQGCGCEAGASVGGSPLAALLAAVALRRRRAAG